MRNDTFKVGDTLRVTYIDVIRLGSYVLAEGDITEVLEVDTSMVPGIYVARTRNINDYDSIKSLVRGGKEAFFIAMDEYEAFELVSSQETIPDALEQLRSKYERKSRIYYEDWRNDSLTDKARVNALSRYSLTGELLEDLRRLQNGKELKHEEAPQWDSK